MIKHFFYIIIVLVAVLLNNLSAQNVVLSRVDNMHENKDAFLYKVSNTAGSQFLGEVEVQGFSTDDALVFNMLYKKAKEIGANTFKLKEVYDIEGKIKSFDPSYYTLSLYYTPKEDIESDRNIYVFSGSSKTQKVFVNDNKVYLPSRSYIMINYTNDKVYVLNQRKFLGSSVTIQPKEKDGDFYFQSIGNLARSNISTSGGIIFKTGDIISLEKSYGDFLSTIYNLTH